MTMDIQAALSSTIDQTNFDGANEVHHGKVRDSFVFDDCRAIVVSDRVSSFDFVLGTIPYKGAVLNQIAAWWFAQLDTIGVPHHLLSVPHPNVSVVKNAKVLPIEVVVRAYLTGSTTTSSWYAYQNHDRVICGIEMPEGMVKNQRFEKPIITPSSKPEIGHDENISKADILSRGVVSEEMYLKVEEYALKMFDLGQRLAAERGLILVDTKYEMGVDEAGNLMVIDEVHTPDSSRYWVAETYEDRMSNGQEPEGLDKEFVRGRLVAAGYDVDSDEDPSKYLDDETRIEAAEKYQSLFQQMTGKVFRPQIEESIEEALRNIV